MKLLRMLGVCLLVVTMAVGQLSTTASPSDAGIIRKGMTAAAVFRIGVLVVRYGKQLHHVSKIMPTRQQISLLKDCFARPGCVNLSNLKTTWDSQRVRVIADWERATGRTWPTYEKDVLNNAGKVIKHAGDRWEGHHIIPKGAGGPNEWWNIHPVPRPDHQAIIHARDSFLARISELVK